MCVCARVFTRNVQRSDPLKLEFQVFVCWEPNKPAARASNTAELNPQPPALFPFHAFQDCSQWHDVTYTQRRISLL